MIISASRRTDIPAFYAPWFMNRLREGHVLVPHPRRAMSFSRVPLSREVVDCIVFWTKNPGPMLPLLDELDTMGYPYYFQCTLTPYDTDIEPHLPPKSSLLSLCRALGERLGPSRVIWRYDPVIATRAMGADEHLRRFEEMAAALSGAVQRCTFSFLDYYHKIRAFYTQSGILPLEIQDMERLAAGFSQTAQRWGFSLSACCEQADLSPWGVSRAACIDGALIGQIVGVPLRTKQDTGQRPGCGCVASVDIGAYDTCLHGCRYCYANASEKTARRNAALHDPCAPLLFGRMPEGAVITERVCTSLRDAQQRLF